MVFTDQNLKDEMQFEEFISKKNLVLIDGNSLLFRAFFAVPPNLVSPDGHPTNAVYGFMLMLTHFLEAFSPDAIICAFDGGTPQFRLEKSNHSYKGNRDKNKNAGLVEQFPIIEDVLEAANIPHIRIKGWEGDDIIGTISNIVKDAERYNTYILSSDKDMFQLVDDTTFIVSPIKGMREVIVYDTGAVKEKTGVYPRQIPDLKGIQGDTSDNIKGIPGIGEKGAVSLLNTYDSLEQIAAHLDEIPGAVGKKMREHIEEGFNCRTVATISRQLNLLDNSWWFEQAKKLKTDDGISIISNIKFPSYDVEKLTNELKKYGFSDKSINNFIDASNSDNIFDDQNDDNKEQDIEKTDETEVVNKAEFCGSLFD